MNQPQADAFVTHTHETVVMGQDETNYIIPFGDVHRFAQNCDVDAWKDFLKWGAKKKRALFVGVGDYDDIGSATERKAWAIASGGIHDDFRHSVNEMINDKCVALCKELEPIKDRIIGLMDGNHSFRFAEGDTYTQRMCTILQVPYLGINCFIRIPIIIRGRPKGTRLKVDIWAHHGTGGGSTTGGSAQWMEKMAQTCLADIYLAGHNHHKHVVPRAFLAPVQGGGKLYLKQIKQLFVRTGSFLKAYVDGKSSYVVEKALRPSDLGVVKIELTPKRKTFKCKAKKQRTDHWRIDLHASI